MAGDEPEKRLSLQAMTAKEQLVTASQICQTVLGSDEIIKIATIVANRSGTSEKPKSESVVLAIISNVESGEAEEACIIAVHGAIANAASDISRPNIAGLCPILADTKIDFEQVEDRSHTSILEDDGLARKACFRVAFSSVSASAAVSVITDDIESLFDILAEAKRLIAAAEQLNLLGNGTSHAWMRAYATQLPKLPPRRRDTAGAAPRSDTFSGFLSSVIGSRVIDGLPTLSSAFNTLGTYTQPKRPRGATGGGILPGGTSMFAPPAYTTRNDGADDRLNRKDPNKDDVMSSIDSDTRQILEDRRAEYTKMRELKVHVCSYNLNGQFYDPKVDLTAWLRPKEKPDIVVVGLQEMDLRPEVLMVRHDPLVGEAWARGILNTLNTPTNQDSKRDSFEEVENTHSTLPYVMITCKQLAGLWLAVFALQEHTGHIRDVQVATVMTGFAGLTANKGACGVRFLLGDEHVCFVVAHLAAFQDAADRRNADFLDISTRLQFVSEMTSHGGYIYSRIVDSAATVFFGDLNYRLDHSMDGIRSLLASRTFTPLLAHDQLKLAQVSSAAFVGFIEHDITFSCTYKYDRGTDNYDSSEKERKPAWTDRILWKINRSSPTSREGKIENTERDDELRSVSITCDEYDSVMQMRLSDHKPVFTRLRVSIPWTDYAKRDKVLAEIRSSTDS